MKRQFDLLQYFAGEEAPAQEAQQPVKPTWEELMEDPEYNRRMQQTVRRRLGEARDAQQKLETLDPALRHLARQQGMDPDHLDHAALAEAVTAENSPRRRVERHMASLREQEKQLRQRLPGFSLVRELQDPTFARLVSPGVGLGVEDAYYALHRRQLEGAAAREAAARTARQFSAAVRSGEARPEEGGLSRQAGTVTATDYRRLPKEDREKLKTRIRAAAARGEKVYPGA